MGKNLVISAINIVDGGALTVLQDAIKAFDLTAHEDDEIIFLVSSPAVHSNIKTNFIRFKYFPSSKKSWTLRLFFEYIYFFLYSLHKKPDIWFSLHDITPSVSAKKRYVYCHNPSIFLNFPLKDIPLDPKQFLFSLLYKYLYKINIKKNTAVITQQAWMADEFSRIFKIENLIVSEPDTTPTPHTPHTPHSPTHNNDYILFYPAYPRYFKNHEIIFKASNIKKDIKFWLTINGKENKYAQRLLEKQPGTNIELLGLLEKPKVFDLYAKCDALVFPSLLETWGLPLTEFKNYDKPIIAADLPYAHETLGNYNKIYWFSPHSPESLNQAIIRAQANLPPDTPKPVNCLHEKLIGWRALASYMLREQPK